MVDTWRKSMESQKSIGENDNEIITLLEPVENIEDVWAMEPIGSNSGLDKDEEFLKQTSEDFIGAEETINDVVSHRQLSDLMEAAEFDEDNLDDNLVFENEEKNRLDFDNFFDTDNEEEEETYDAESSSADREKLEEESRGEIDETELEDNDVDVLADIPAEILRDRQALIEKLRELRNEEPDLRRKNRLYQYWVSRVMNKKHQKMRPEDETLSSRYSENRYIKELFSYKISVDEIEARQDEIKVELANMENSLKTILDDDSETFGELLNRQREIGVGLKYEKSARILSVKAIEEMIRRQIIHRDLMNRDRFHYIFYRHRYEDLKAKIRRVETLGDGMTIMDYEIIRHENYCHKEKLEEREKELEKLYNNIVAMLNRLANYKQLEASNIANIHHEKNHLDLLKSKVLKNREEAFQALKTLLRTRRACEMKKRRGGMLFAQPVLHEMEKALKDFTIMKLKIEEMFPQEKNSFNEVHRSLQTDGSFKVDENCKTVTRMTKVKRSSANSKKPGRC